LPVEAAVGTGVSLDPRERHYGANEDVRVVALAYANPLETVLLLTTGGIVLALLRVLRNWSTDKQIRGASRTTFPTPWPAEHGFVATSSIKSPVGISTCPQTGLKSS
jgi:hypothetical protein